MQSKGWAGLVSGMVLLALGAQGGIRLLADHDDRGLLGWVPGGFAACLSCYAVITLAGSCWPVGEAHERSGPSRTPERQPRPTSREPASNESSSW
ncbi:hypothetical protein [Amycolatopsis vancoresmycina]|uniref:hypothetical protein n=1 Tax=Amycolatopsis vancoresmycina TaxID=208444 RepID=UPI001ADFD436|nr:hypothetical protein [Amycolatopsis vancoresmycina]